MALTPLEVMDAVVTAWDSAVVPSIPGAIVDRTSSVFEMDYSGVPVFDEGGWWLAVKLADTPATEQAILFNAEGQAPFDAVTLGSPAQVSAQGVFASFGLTVSSGYGWTAGTGAGLNCVAMPARAACTLQSEAQPSLDAAHPVLASVPASNMIDAETGQGTPVYGMPRVSESPVGGYSRAEFAQWGAGSWGGATAQSYLPPGGVWTYFRSAQQGPSCSAYDTPELRDAFAGVRCLLEDGTTIEVTPDRDLG